MKASERFVLPRDEMAFRRIYRIYLEKKTVTVVFRPGRRLCNDYRGYQVGQIVKARVIEHLGLDRAQVAPIFLSEFQRMVRIETIEAKTIGSLVASDFLGSTPDVYDQGSLVFQLGLIYNLDPHNLSGDSVVTRICFSYVE
ncbi:MAG: hypothetical protein WCG60_02390 [bacterium]